MSQPTPAIQQPPRRQAASPVPISRGPVWPTALRCQTSDLLMPLLRVQRQTEQLHSMIDLAKSVAQRAQARRNGKRAAMEPKAGAASPSASPSASKARLINMTVEDCPPQLEGRLLLSYTSSMS